jgi:ParB-like chromosome segregation protein Spo0J
MTNATEQASWSANELLPIGRSSPTPLTALDVLDTTVEVPISGLNIDFSPRRGGLRADHVDALAELGGRWPPIVVGRADQRVIDGLHRVAAARQLGHRKIVAKLVEVSEDEAYIASIKGNIEHGLPLTLAERKDAANQILQGHPSWSDRRIATICGLSPGTLGTLRAQPREQPDHADQNAIPAERRTGRDGKSRPVNTVATRQRVAEAIAETPDQSLRKIGSRVGASPETVRAVRAQLASTADEPGDEEWWCRDAALGSSDGGKHLVAWLGRTNVDRATLGSYVHAIPMSRTYNLAAEARRRAAVWAEFADELEMIVRSRRT